jgi:hypothetical protein
VNASRGFISAYAAAVALLCSLPAGATAQEATTIDFEEFSGPEFFGAVDPPLTIGLATFSGGQLLRAVSGLTANQSTVYGTADFCAGCARTIAITFSQPIRDFSILVMNGEPLTVSYTVEGDSGTSHTRTLAPFGAETFSLTESAITSVSVRPTNPDPIWDFFIDNVTFKLPLATSTDQCKNGGWRNFPGFKNQGDCVSFVATNGKNQPSGF